ncbi:MAG: molybdopterin cofactor-binding domain-containing protein, partial [Acidobacteriota bacterium]
MRENFGTDEIFEPERAELGEKPRYHFSLNRRHFLEVTGAGLLITALVEVAPGQRRRGEPVTLAARLHIAEDGTVTILTSKVEIGQGSRTQITQAAAEEMGIPVEEVRLVMADTKLVPNDGATSGSRTTPRTVPSVRKAAAAAREILVARACAEWNTQPNRVELVGGAVQEKSTKRRLTYASLARSDELASAYQEAVPSEVTVRSVSDWRVLGASVEKVGGWNIVTGAHRFPSDIQRPNMLYGKLLRPPSYGAKVTSVDLTPAENMDGVNAIHDGNFIGCVAPTSFGAQKAVEAIGKTARWTIPEHPSSKEIFSYLKNHTVAEGSGFRSSRTRTKGSLEEGFAQAAGTLAACYEVPYIQHVPLEPRAAVAEWEGDHLTVWTGTQRPYGVRNQLMEAFHLPPDKVRVIVPDTGGGFGGKHTGEVGIEAARLSREVNRPVSLCWTREEEFTWAYFRPAGLFEVRAGMDAQGKIVAWDFTNYNAGASAMETPYEIPHTRTKYWRCDSPLRTGSYRAIGSTANNYAREVFMDELALTADADPLEFRLANLTNPRLRAVLEAAAERFGWKRRKENRKPTIGVGISGGTEKGSYVAACVEVEVDRAKGSLKVREICQAFECGAIQNPANLRSQVEGCVIMGLGGAMSEAIQFENGRISNGLLSKYPVPRFKDVPKLEIVLVDRKDLASAGAGETPIIAIAPAIANAAYAASGVRVRSLPVRGEAFRVS